MKKLWIVKTYKYRKSAMNRKVQIIKILPLLLIFLVCIANAVSAQQQDESVVAVVIRINGSLEFRKSVGEDWGPAIIKQQLYNGNQLRTAIGNRAVIVYTSGTRILINENTELEIAAQMPPGKFKKPTSERTKLLIGEVYSKLKEKKEAGYSYEVETPTSVASVRGTEFNSQFAEGQATYLSMLNVVEIMNQLGTVLLQQYQKTTVAQGEAPTEPETLTKGQAEKQTVWTDAVEPIWKLNLVPEGGTSQAIGEAFNITVWAENTESGSIDTNASFTLSAFITSSDALEFSTDGGKNWGGAPEINIANGQARIMARGVSEDSVTITVEAEDSEPASISIGVTTPKGKKTLQLNFTDPDGSGEETLIMEIEEK